MPQFFASPPVSAATDAALPPPPLVVDSLDRGLVRAGLRRTRATRAVLALFLADGSLALTHADVEGKLRQLGAVVNRVTLYRLLDRLVTAGLLTRHADDAARTWRYGLAPGGFGAGVVGAQALAVKPGNATGRAGEVGAASEGGFAGAGVVPRFECDACHRQFHWTQAGSPTQAAAEQLLKTLATLGHQGQRVDLSIHGTCAVCVDPLDAAGVAPASASVVPTGAVNAAVPATSAVPSTADELPAHGR